MKPDKAELGDVVIATKLICHDLKKIKDNSKPEYRGPHPEVSPRIEKFIQTAALNWKAPLKDPESKEVKIHRAAMLTGSVLLNSADAKQKLADEFPVASFRSSPKLTSICPIERSIVIIVFFICLRHLNGCKAKQTTALQYCKSEQIKATMVNRTRQNRFCTEAYRIGLLTLLLHIPDYFSYHLQSQVIFAPRHVPVSQEIRPPLPYLLGISPPREANLLGISLPFRNFAPPPIHILNF
jgi:hypothetical protein